jgi:hypothetical protein
MYHVLGNLGQGKKRQKLYRVSFDLSRDLLDGGLAAGEVARSVVLVWHRNDRSATVGCLWEFGRWRLSLPPK